MGVGIPDLLAGCFSFTDLSIWHDSVALLHQSC